MTDITIVDYGMGNLLSVSRAVEHCGARPRLTSSPDAVESASLLILPGVGAFGDGMTELGKRGLADAICRYAESGRPLLGICLGMQMLMDVGEEFGMWPGLGLIPGRVVQIPPTGVDGTPHKIPHTGWTALLLPPGVKGWEGTILAGVAPGSAAYFVHSFAALPDNPADRLADCSYDGLVLSAAVRRGNLYGCQFHPEKSAQTGIAILQAFIALGVAGGRGPDVTAT